MIVETFDGVPVSTAIEAFLPRATSHYTRAMKEYAIKMLLAGRHDEPRRIVVRFHGLEREFRPDDVPNRTELRSTTLLELKQLPGAVGYVKFDNSLGNNATIASFDRAIDRFRRMRGLIVDLTDTPSGGNTTVARAILGHFVRTTLPYQEIVYPDEERLYGVRRAQLDLVSPRGPRFARPVVVLVNRWTGSVGEALAIGFSATTNDRIVGGKMAGLLGAICTFDTPNAAIGFALPCERTLAVNGIPRERFRPSIGSGESGDIAVAERLLSHP
jgi:carboxyl-terminal processing protease